MAKKANKKQLRKANEMLNANVTDLNTQLRVSEASREAWKAESDKWQFRTSEQDRRNERLSSSLRTTELAKNVALADVTQLRAEKADVGAELATTKGRFEDALKVIDGVRQWIESTDTDLQEVFNDASETLRELAPEA